ncbi:hypothetical protein B0H11DRAFT_202507 [Mycena galericulata]|nr:hypothetical protein B0H11DRAFT_202507 [Mycena galericulata]
MTLEEDLAQLGFTGPDAALRLKILYSAQLLAWFLSSPEDTKLCAASVVKVMQRVLPPDEDGKFCIRLLRTDCGPCLDGLIQLVAVPRTEEQLRQLQTRLNQCHCDLTNEIVEVVHEADNDSAGRSFKGMIASIFTALAGVVLNGLKIGHVVGGTQMRTTESPETAAAKKWPANIATLFPAGQDAAVISFARLFRLTGSSAVLDYIRIVLPHCPSLAQAISESALFWEVAVERLQVAVDNFHEDPSLIGGDPDPETSAEMTGSHEVIKALVMFLTSFVPTFTETLRQKLSSSVPLMAHGCKLHDLFLKVLLLAKGSPKEDELAAFCFLVAGMALCVANPLPKHQRPRRLHPLIRSYSRLQCEPSAWAFTRVFVVLSQLAAVAQCCRIGCAETSETSAQKLRYCARCRLMRYCSSGCQKAAWKEHKGICTDLQTLHTKVMPVFSDKSTSEWADVETGPTGRFMQEFERKTRKLGFGEDRMKELSEELEPFCDFKGTL